MRSILAILLFLTISGHSSGQDTVRLDREHAISLAIRNNSSLRGYALSIEEQSALVRTGYNWSKTNVYYSEDQNNIAENGVPVNVWGVRQGFAFPTVYHTSKKALTANVERTMWQFELMKLRMMQQVSEAYVRVSYYETLVSRYRLLDSLYNDFAYAARRRFETGESNYLEQITADAKEKEVRLLLLQHAQQLEAAQIELQGIIQSDSVIMVSDTELNPLVFPMEDSLATHPALQMFDAARSSAEWSTKSVKNQYLPDILVEYFQGTNNAPSSKVYRGFEVGLALPLFFGTQQGRIKSGTIQQEIIIKQKENYVVLLTTRRKQLENQLIQIQNALSYYESNGRNLARELIRASQRSFQEGEINYFQYIQNIDSAVRMEIGYLENVLNQNLTSIALYYLAPEP